MKRVCYKVLPIYLITVGILLMFLLSHNLTAEDKKTPSPSAASKLSKDMVGVWTLIGSPDDAAYVPPEVETALKFRTGRHWLVTYSDPNGMVLYHHGGTYTLDGDEYVETIEYANENTAGLIKNSFKFKVKVEGDSYTQIGIENPWSEIWRRVE